MLKKAARGKNAVKRLAQREKAFLANARITMIGKSLRCMVLRLSEENASQETIHSVVKNMEEHCIGNHANCLKHYAIKVEK